MERRTSGSGAEMRTLLATLTVTVGRWRRWPACAAGAATAGPGGQATPTTQHTPAKTPTGRPTALPKASCGSAVTHGLSAATQILSADKGALNCFHVAARDCKTASLEVTEMGVDTGNQSRLRCRAWRQGVHGHSPEPALLGELRRLARQDREHPVQCGRDKRRQCDARL